MTASIWIALAAFYLGGVMAAVGHVFYVDTTVEPVEPVVWRTYVVAWAVALAWPVVWPVHHFQIIASIRGWK